MSDEQFGTEMDELDKLAAAHIEAMRVDQEQWEAEMYALCDLADRIDAVARVASHDTLNRLLTAPVPSRPTIVGREEKYGTYQHGAEDLGSTAADRRPRRR